MNVICCLLPLLAALAAPLAAQTGVAERAAAPVPASTNAYYQSYVVPGGDPEALVEAIREASGGRGKLIYYRPNGRLLVNAPPDVHALVQAMLRELAVPARNIRIDVTFGEQGSVVSSGGSVSGTGQVVVGPGGTSSSVQIRPEIHAGSTTMTGGTRQQLLLQSGSEAALSVGQEVPFVDQLVRWGRDWGYMAPSFVYSDVGASLKVRARALGDGELVQVTLTPELSGLVDGQPQRVRFTRVATDVTVANGGTVEIGAFGEHADFYRVFLAGLDRSRSQRSTRISLRVTVETPQP